MAGKEAMYAVKQREEADAEKEDEVASPVIPLPLWTIKVDSVRRTPRSQQLYT
jgi:hypothetical protein